MASLRIAASIQDTTNSSTVGTSSLTVTTSANYEYKEVKNIGTSEESIALPSDLTSAGTGYLYVKNRDATNYVQIGTATTVYWMRVKAGEVAVVPLDNAITTLYLKANTAACDVEVYARCR